METETVTKPCPFCGSIDTALERKPHETNKHLHYRYIKCNLCHCRGPKVISDDVAYWLWNERQRELTIGIIDKAKAMVNTAVKCAKAVHDVLTEKGEDDE
jgi:hypothetical protein